MEPPANAPPTGQNASEWQNVLEADGYAWQWRARRDERARGLRRANSTKASNGRVTVPLDLSFSLHAWRHPYSARARGDELCARHLRVQHFQPQDGTEIGKRQLCASGAGTSAWNLERADWWPEIMSERTVVAVALTGSRKPRPLEPRPKSPAEKMRAHCVFKPRTY